MPRIVVKQKNDQFIVKRKIERSESLNEREIQIFNTKRIRGLVRPFAEGKKITYIVPANITLQKYLKSGITKNEFFLMIAQILELTKKIERHGFNISNLVLNAQYVFFNKMTKEIHFIYQPVISSNISASVFSFLNDVAYTAVIQLNEDMDFINEFLGFLQHIGGYSEEEIEKYILNKHPETYKQVKREQPKSAVLYNKRWQAEKAAELEKTIVDSKNIKKVYDDSPTGLLDQGYDDGPTGLLDQGYDDGPTGLLDQGYDDGPTGLLNQGYGDDSTGLLNQEYDDNPTGLLNPEDEGRFMETSLLVEEANPSPIYPYIIRMTTYEQADINKPVYRIGKERSYVDFFVPNNSAVSRLHADIVTQNDNYYIRDNNSTNGTYLNGSMIKTGLLVELHDGDQIMLANESFEFHVR